MTVREEARQIAVDRLSKELELNGNSPSFLEIFGELIDEYSFDIEVDLIIKDITKAFKKEAELGEMSIETQEIIGGLIELVYELYKKRVEEHEQ